MAIPALKSKGWILVQMLLFSSICILFILGLLESCLLQTKMNQNFKTILSARKKAWANLNIAQLNIPVKCDEIKYPLIQFVPDTLHWGEQEGVSYYRIKVFHELAGAKVQLDSVFATRCARQQAVNDFDIERLKEKYQMRYWVLASLKHVDTLDTIYFVNDKNQVSKLIKDPNISDEWHMMYTITIPMAILGAPLIGPSATVGAMIYLAVEDDQGKQSIISINDNLFSFQESQLRIDLNRILSKPLLRQNYLVVADQESTSHILIYNRFTGQYFRSCNFKHSHNNEFSALSELKVIEKYGNEKPFVEVQDPGCASGCFVEIDVEGLGSRLVRYVH